MNIGPLLYKSYRREPYYIGEDCPNGENLDASLWDD